MARFANSVLFTTAAAPGTSDFTASAAVQGYMMPALAGAPTGTYKYRAESTDLSQWEIGEGTYTSGTGVLTRTTVLYNSSGTGTASGQSGAGSKINFSSNIPQIGLVQTVEDTLGIDQANTWTVSQKVQGRANVGIDVRGSDVASAATINLDTATGDIVRVTGTTTITAITLTDGQKRAVVFTGALVLTAGASLVLPDGASITTAAGDVAIFVADGTTIRCESYSPSSGFITSNPVPTSSGGSFTTISSTVAYKKIGKIVVCRVTITITSAGTATGNVILTLPFSVASRIGAPGKETAVNGFTWMADVSGSTFQATRYDNASMIGNGIVLCGTFATEWA